MNRFFISKSNTRIKMIQILSIVFNIFKYKTNSELQRGFASNTVTVNCQKKSNFNVMIEAQKNNYDLK